MSCNATIFKQACQLRCHWVHAVKGSHYFRESRLKDKSCCAGTLFGATTIPVIDNSGGIAPFCDATGQFMPLLCTMNCTLAPEEVRL